MPHSTVRLSPPPAALRALAAAALLATVAACDDDPTAAEPDDPSDSVVCAADNGGITLPAGFCASVVADNVGPARHLVVRENGDVYVAINNDGATKGAVLALRDADDDGVAEVSQRFGGDGGSGIAMRNEFLYFGIDSAVVRFALPAGALVPTAPAVSVVSALPSTGDHTSKTVVISGDRLFVNIGSASNSCQVQNRVAGSPGVDPCPELAVRAGVWRFDADVTGQTQDDGTRWVTGFRNGVALAASPSGRLFGLQHGRDHLHEHYPALFPAAVGVELPSEELLSLDQGDDFGWPYCFHDPAQDAKVLAPEYGGDGDVEGRCTTAEEPLMDFPSHWAPNGMLFYTGRQFPARYRTGAFIAFHGSHNRDPVTTQQGYRVVFVPFSGGAPSGPSETFADNFAGGVVNQPSDAAHRPVGLAMGSDGTLYITDDKGGRIWRVVYRGS